MASENADLPHFYVVETPAEIRAKLDAAEREAKFEERVHRRAEALYCLWVKEEVDDPSHEAAYDEALRFVAKGQSMIDAFFAAERAERERGRDGAGEVGK